jgi:hypothetical protein
VARHRTPAGIIHGEKRQYHGSSTTTSSKCKREKKRRAPERRDSAGGRPRQQAAALAAAGVTTGGMCSTCAVPRPRAVRGGPWPPRQSTRVPKRFADDPALGLWVSTQRRAYAAELEREAGQSPSSTSRISAARVKKLQRVGFEWEVEARRAVGRAVRGAATLLDEAWPRQGAAPKLR